MNDEASAIKQTILSLLNQREPGKSICPSEAARAIYPYENRWRAEMPTVRRIAAELVALGLIEVTQGGRVVDIDHAKGAIRLRLS